MRPLLLIGLSATLLAGCTSPDALSGQVNDVADVDSAPEEPTGEDPVEETDVDVDEDDEPAVMIGDFFFDSEAVSVAVGETIAWTHAGDITHNVTARDGSFASESLTRGDTFRHTFATAGTFDYRCTLHTQMVATVQVD